MEECENDFLSLIVDYRMKDSDVALDTNVPGGQNTSNDFLSLFVADLTINNKVPREISHWICHPHLPSASCDISHRF